jgi:hypothetical protein
MKEPSKIEQQEALLNAIEKLLDINYEILRVVDARLTVLEDHIDLETKKRKGN